MSRPSRPVRLKRIAAPAPNTRHLIMEVADSQPFDFEPGQHVCLSATVNGERIDRYYSIASEPDGRGVFELCVKPVGDGSPFGDYLAQVKPGETFECAAPGGSFRLANTARDAIFLAAGTGITPLRAMLRHSLATNGVSGPELTLIFGARQPEELYFRDEFETLAQTRKNFNFWPTISGPPNDWPGRRGRVQQHLQEALGNRLTGVDVYLCGPKAMVDDVRAALTASGFDERAVHYEKYG
jgi:ferredoxin-NADP reductase